jgi:hypothetical protein
MEHRCGQRHAVDFPVRLRTNNGVLAQGRIQDLSFSGAFIVTPVALPQFSEVHVIPLPQREGIRASDAIPAQVIRRTDAGMAIEWTEVGLASVRVLLERVHSEAVWEAAAPLRERKR